MNPSPAATACSPSLRNWNNPCRPMNSQPKSINRILDGIRDCRTFCVVGHVRPDGDCIGSQLGLTLALQNQGKRVVCWNEDGVPRKLAFLDPDHLIKKPRGGM